MKYTISLLMLTLLVGHAMAGLLPSGGGSSKVLPGGSGSSGGKLLPSNSSSNKKVLPGSNKGGGKVLPGQISNTGGGDFFAQATKLRGVADMKQLTNNEEATKELGEPNHGNYSGNPGGKSLWWRYEGIRDGTLTISTKGSKFDTVLGVYVGDSVGTLAQVAADNDGGPDIGTSLVTLRVFANSFYYIAVDGYNGASGDIVLSITFKETPLSNDGAPYNDNFSNRKRLFGAYALDYGSNANATLEADDPFGISSVSGQNVWWEWTAPATGTVTLSTEGSSYDTTLFVYYGDAKLSALNLITYDDQGVAGTNASLLKFQAYEGETYYIAVDGWLYSGLFGLGRSVGEIVLTVDLQPHESTSYISDFGTDGHYFYLNNKYIDGRVPPVNDAFAYRIGIQGTSFTSESTTSNAYWLEDFEPDHGRTGSSYFTTWWTWTAPKAGILQVTSTADEESSLIPVVSLYLGKSADTLTSLASNVGTEDSGKASVLKQVKEGQVVHIAVAGDESTSGAHAFTLKLLKGEIKVKTHPKSVTSAAGLKVAFKVVPTDKTLTPIRYQWETKKGSKWVALKDGSAFAGTKAAQLSVRAAPARLSGTQYRCVLTNSVGKVTSKAAKLTIR